MYQTIVPMMSTPSLSESSSQLSPTPSPSASSCPEFGKRRQLSCWHEYSVQLSGMSGSPSPSVSFPHFKPFPAYPGLQTQISIPLRFILSFDAFISQVIAVVVVVIVGSTQNTEFKR